MPDPIQDLPPALAAWFALGEQADEAALAACFTPDAVVRDEGREHRGIAAIADWRRETKAQTQFTARPLALHERDGRLIVPAEVSGNFPNSPVTLDHAFTLADGRIAALEIG